MLRAEKLNALTHILGYAFQDQQLLAAALTHRSFHHENPGTPGPNERLEFLGDAVLQLMITTALYTRHPQLAEGQLSKLRGHAVSEPTLSALARKMGLQDHLLLGKGEARGADARDSVLADALEAVLGAIYLDGGPGAAQAAWQRWESALGVDLLDPRHLEDFDAKSRLQEFCLKTWQELPSYEAQEVREGGRPALFRVSLRVHGRPLLSTENPSKRKAELWLARACLDQHLHLTAQGA